jgi:hypothetical protein
MTLLHPRFRLRLGALATEEEIAIVEEATAP